MLVAMAPLLAASQTNTPVSDCITMCIVSWLVAFCCPELLLEIAYPPMAVTSCSVSPVCCLYQVMIGEESPKAEHMNVTESFTNAVAFCGFSYMRGISVQYMKL